MAKEKFNRTELEKKPYYELKKMCEELGLIGYYSGDRYTSATLIQMLLDFSGSSDDQVETVDEKGIIKENYTKQELDSKSYKEVAFICNKLGIVDKANSWRFDFNSLVQKILEYQENQKVSVVTEKKPEIKEEKKVVSPMRKEFESKSYDYLKKLCIDYKIIPGNRNAYSLFFNENAENKEKIIDLILQYAEDSNKKSSEQKPENLEIIKVPDETKYVEKTKPADKLKSTVKAKPAEEIKSAAPDKNVVPAAADKSENTDDKVMENKNKPSLNKEIKKDKVVLSKDEYIAEIEDSDYYINNDDDTRFERVKKVYEQLANVTTTDDIKVAAKINLYDGLDVVPRDKYAIETTIDISRSMVLLINGERTLCGIMRISEDKNNKDQNVFKYYLRAFKEDLKLTNIEHKGYSLLFFHKRYQNFLKQLFDKEVDAIPENFQAYKVGVDVNIRKLEGTQTVLCIDFGMSNTTAGCYLDDTYVSEISNSDILNKNIIKNDVNFVKFVDFNDDETDIAEVMPTMVYVKNCKDTNNIKFLFGYQAKEAIKKVNYCPEATVFYGIKRWVTCLDEDEIVNDEYGNIAHVKHSLILRQFLFNVINQAEQQFKCKFKNLHISSPVKLKTQFLEAFTVLIPEYNVENKYALDEGVAVLYNIIADKLKEGSLLSEDSDNKALIIDCGGGTTDLVSCLFKIQEGPFAYDVDITTSFENGDSNFGGNNITYRIMQFMKITFANYYNNSKEKVDIDTLIPLPSSEIFRVIDDNKSSDIIYTDFETAYNKAEAIIPTKFRDYENRTKNEYSKVKNNFYFMWELAEEMKKQFYKKTTILRNKFDSKDQNSKKDDLNITKLQKWNLSVFRDGKLIQINDFPDVVFNIKEINKLIKGDIYNIIRKFLEGLYDRKELTSYNIIKLTGQSCKIELFKEALKEFVPGRSIKYEQFIGMPRKDMEESAYSYQDTLELKLSCLKGVIRYFQSKKQGDIEVNLVNEIPVIPYCLIVYDYKGNEVVLIDRQTRVNKAKGSIPKPLSTTEVDFYLKNNSGKEAQVIKTYKFCNDPSAMEASDLERIQKETNGMITEEDIEKIALKSISFFAFADDSSWGFFVLPITKKSDGSIYLGKKQHYAFEEDLSTIYFFDGNK